MVCSYQFESMIYVSNDWKTSVFSVNERRLRAFVVVFVHYWFFSFFLHVGVKQQPWNWKKKTNTHCDTRRSVLKWKTVWTRSLEWLEKIHAIYFEIKICVDKMYSVLFLQRNNNNSSECEASAERNLHEQFRISTSFVLRMDHIIKLIRQYLIIFEPELERILTRTSWFEYLTRKNWKKSMINYGYTVWTKEFIISLALLRLF